MKRLHILKEIVETEKTYISSLESILDVVEEKIKANLSDILRVNHELLRQLEEARNSAMLSSALVNENSDGNSAELLRKELVDFNVGKIFNRITPFLKIYSIYIKTYPHTISGLPSDSTRSLRSVLLTPIQRIPRYRLLLLDLLNHTPGDHDDHAELSKAYKSIEDVASYVNEMIHTHDLSIKMVQLQKSVKYRDTFPEPHTLLEPGRRLLRIGSVMKVCRKNVQRRILLLFSDCLIYGSSSTSSSSNSEDNSSNGGFEYVLHRKFELEGMTVSESMFDQNTLAISVCTMTKSFMFVAKDGWLDAIKNAVQEYEKNKQTFRSSNLSSPLEGLSPNESFQSTYAPVWVPDASVEDCMECNAKFTLIKRRHHCRMCGRVVCNPCSKYRMCVYNSELVRVCERCFASNSTPSEPPEILAQEVKGTGHFGKLHLSVLMDLSSITQNLKQTKLHSPSLPAPNYFHTRMHSPSLPSEIETSGDASTENDIMEGPIVEKGKNFQSYKLRRLVLTKKNLSWFNDGELLNSLDLKNVFGVKFARAEDVCQKSCKQKFIEGGFDTPDSVWPFKLETDETTLYLACGKEEERDRWVLALTVATRDLKRERRKMSTMTMTSNDVTLASSVSSYDKMRTFSVAPSLPPSPPEFLPVLE